MDNEKKFITESVRVFLGSLDKSAISKKYKSLNITRIKQLILDYNIGGLFYNMYIDNVFTERLIDKDLINFLKWQDTQVRNRRFQESLAKQF